MAPFLVCVLTKSGPSSRLFHTRPALIRLDLGHQQRDRFVTEPFFPWASRTRAPTPGDKVDLSPLPSSLVSRIQVRPPAGGLHRGVSRR